MTRCRRCAEAVVVRIWNTLLMGLIAIFGNPRSPYYVYSYMNSYVNLFLEYSHILIHI